MSSPFIVFGQNLITQLGSAGASALAANPNLASQIAAAAASTFGDPNQQAELNDINKAEALVNLNAAAAVQVVADIIKLLPARDLGIIAGLEALTASTPALQFEQALELARGAIQRGG